jgi:uncharacterized damage-inducible protein DinB
MTPDTFKLLARYNGHANTKMGQVLAQLNDKEWNQTLGGYYPSIRSLCSHLFVTDLNWLKRFARHRPFDYAEHPILQKHLVLGDLLFASFRDYDPDRRILDELLAKLIDELQPEVLLESLQYKDWRGIDQVREVGGLLLHMFNHETHHRGMISLYLDMLGKENDFSNLFVLL